MGLYSRVIFPRLMNWAMSGAVFSEQRRLALAAVRGDVLEIGFGSGLNLPHYPAGVRRLTAIDANPGMSRLARRQMAKSPIQVDHAVLDGERLPMPDASFDAVVSTWTLCSIPDVNAALAEVRRVLRPGGSFRFLEHGLSHEPAVARWQHRLNPLQNRLGDGCNLNRDFRTIIAAAGFRIDALETFYLKKTPRVAGYMYRGVAGTA